MGKRKDIYGINYTIVLVFGQSIEIFVSIPVGQLDHTAIYMCTT